MKKSNFFLISLNASILVLPILSISCKSDEIYASSDISNINDTFKEEQIKIYDLLNRNDETTKQIKDYINENPIIQITAAGKVNDNSFNQMTWEAISSFSKLADIKTSTYKETKTPSPAEMFQAYSDALNKNYKIWILTGWSQEQFFAEWIKIPFYRNKFYENKIKVISIDWDVNKYLCDVNENGESIPWGTGISLNFKTQESSFLIGYSVSKFLAEKYPGEENKHKRILNNSAGADASGSTNFNYGFVEGIRTWNDEQLTNDTKVSHNIYKDDSKVFLETTYIDNNPLTRNDFTLSIKGGGTQIFKENAPTIIMPVAGDWSRTAANIIKEGNNKEQWVVGVDSNMAISYGKTYESYFITSSEKRIGIATFKALCFLMGISQTLNDPDLYPNSTDISWKINFQEDVIEQIVISDTSKELNKVENMSVNGGIELGFVGASASTLSNSDDAKKFDQIVLETEKKFFTGTDAESQKTLLRNNVDEVALKAYDVAKTSNNIQEYDQAVFNLKNVVYGEMTAGNKSYFNMIIDEINKWLI